MDESKLKKMTRDDIEDFTAGLPDGDYVLLIDRFELELSRRLQPNLLIHFMVAKGPAEGTFVFKRVWLNNRKTALRLYYTLSDYAAMPRKDHWNAEKMTAAMAGKVFTARFKTIRGINGDWHTIDLPIVIDEARAKTLRAYEKELFR